MKDNFSSRSKEYRKFRPGYPPEVFQLIRQHLTACDSAWDCGTGNGQVAAILSDFFHLVEATDISENQLKNAINRRNIKYSVQPAEKTDFCDNQFDLIITAQAVHWFDFEQFYSELKRCLKPEGLFVILGYGLFHSNPETNRIIENFYQNIVGPYWDKERSYLDQNYKTIPFPFQEIKTSAFEQQYYWNIEHLLGYLRTWSAVKHYEKKNREDPVNKIESSLGIAFGVTNYVRFPILLRMGKMDNIDH
ncbi:class I SAM-dependent methyltransferase [Christiangramia sabulilitoris]|uniref:Class I SAM-dependent methyltransferase n=1 Tax=Christiangramia sabulilitoris TaxID=2583991 RepID=A0A550I6I2_9FLAO|nr:class I SAM-dependent methyltransferase [Christiangramia sabulilitoris]TRO66587.1 class I SAM-dependent methyltransferase [Christiangramia sabulilitoris]